MWWIIANTHGPGGGQSFLMLLWKVELLKMNQQQPWEGDEGANYTFPKYWGVATRAWEWGLQGPKSLVSPVTHRSSLTHLRPPPGTERHSIMEPVPLHLQRVEDWGKSEKVRHGVAAWWWCTGANWGALDWKPIQKFLTMRRRFKLLLLGRRGGRPFLIPQAQGHVSCQTELSGGWEPLDFGIRQYWGFEVQIQYGYLEQVARHS